MAKLNIVKVGDSALRKVCRPVTAITPRTLRLLDDMVDTMRRADGVGLAAPQVGILRRIVVIEVEPGEVLELINPEIVEASGEQIGTEGCLSVPGKQGIVKRPSYVRVKAIDRNGVEREYEGTDLLARCFCHELDHLDGKLYIDKATKILYPDAEGYYEYDEDED
ncbi:MAG: peptide deformylase [Clostridia bacterium]|nr:peptide deformylase [Clostridia bacterium]